MVCGLQREAFQEKEKQRPLKPPGSHGNLRENVAQWEKVQANLDVLEFPRAGKASG